LIRTFGAASAAFALSLTLAGGSAALGDTMTKSDTMMKPAAMGAECKNAMAMMNKMAHSDDAMMPAKSTGHVDQDFAKMAMAHGSTMAAMARLELQCGTNAKAKADAQRFLDDWTKMRADLDLILHTP
jgi:hypothetical protein